MNTVHDLTKKATQEEILRLNRLLSALCHVNQAVVRASTPEELFSGVCRTLAEHAHFRLVWIGECDPKTQKVRLVCQAGEGLGFLNGLDVSFVDAPEGRGPTGTAAREGREVVIKDFELDPRIDPWRERTRRFGFRSAASLPIHRHGRVWGTLTVYEAETDFFRDKETSLLVESANDISFAVSRLDEMSERRRAEQALRESEDKYRALIETTGTGYVILDLNGIVRDANLEYVKLSGHETAEQIIGRSLGEWTAPQDKARTAVEIENCVKRGYVRNLEFEYINPRGGSTPVEISATLVNSSGTPVIVSLCRDMTERRRAEAEKRALALRMQQTQKLESMGVMAGGIAHDFNNLLTSVQGHASLAMEMLSPESPLQVNLRRIESASMRAAELCQQMLAYAGKSKVVLESVDISKLIKELIQLLSTNISKKATFEYHLDESVPLIDASPSQVRQVVMNLVINASEAVGDAEGRVVVTTGVRECDKAYLSADNPIESPAPGNYVFFEVTDTGCGMDAATRVRIFDPFFSTKFTGRGLGLAAVLGIVRSHKGALKLVSAPGHGTTFRVLFPASATQSKEATARPTGSLIQGKGTILLVDDEEQIRAVTESILKRLGFQVVTACDGQEAIDVFKQSPATFRCVVLDLAMPKLSGEETLRLLRNTRPEIPVLLVSGFTDRDILNRAGDLSITGFLEKPYDLKSLSSKLAGLLSQEA